MIFMPPTPTQHYLVWIRLQRKFSMLRLLQFLSDLKSTVVIIICGCQIYFVDSLNIKTILKVVETT